MAEGENASAVQTTEDAQEVRSPLEVLFGKDVFSLAGREVQVKRVSVRNIKPLLATVRLLISEIDFKRIDEARTSGTDVNTLSLFESPSQALEFVEKHIDTIIGVVVELTNLSKEDVENLGIDEVSVVIANILAINKSFFLTQVLPLFRKLVKST